MRDRSRERERERMSELCRKPSNLLLMENAVRSFCSVIATHILAGQVDVQLEEEKEEGDPEKLGAAQAVAQLLRRLWWFARYFNPLNLAWRYYSILAFRCLRGKLSRHHLALLNFECFPFSQPPLAYLQAEPLFEYTAPGALPTLSVKRLEISGIFSSQGMLSFIAAYQGLQAIQFTISSSGFGFLPNVTKAMAILGLFRVMVSPWIANKVHVDINYKAEPVPTVPMFPLCLPVCTSSDMDKKKSSCKALAGAWALVMVCLVMLSMRSYLPYPQNSTVPSHLIDRSIELLYNYIALSSLAFHGLFLWQGANALGNRHPLFNHPLYHLQTALFLLLLTATLLVGVVDFVHHDLYSNCFY